MWFSYSIILFSVIIIGIISVTPSAFADHAKVEVNVALGSSTPGCEVTNSCFDPHEAIIDVGGEVTWYNSDTAAHTVTSGDLQSDPDNLGTEFDSSLFGPGKTFSKTFEEAGAFTYFCMLHPWMKGIVVVGNSNPTPTPTPNPSPTLQPSIGRVKIQNTDFALRYEITGGKVTTANIDVEKKALHIMMEMPDDGKLTITLPRSLIDAKKSNDRDDSFRVLADDEETNFSEIVESDSRTLSISFSVGTSKIVIFGTQMIGTATIPSETMSDDENSIQDEITRRIEAAKKQQESQNNPPIPVTISVFTDKSSYNLRDTVTIDISISGVTSEQNIAISVTDPTGNNFVSRSVTTDSNGSADLQFRIPESAKSGTYQVIVTSSVDGRSYQDSTQFSVRSQFNVSIVSVQATDQQGNPVSAFSRGTNGFVKVVLSSESNIQSLITVNLFDSELTSLGIGSFKTTLSPGQSEMILSFFIPDDAVAGSADIYANAFSDWPSNGGTPLTRESSSSVEIR